MAAFLEYGRKTRELEEEWGARRKAEEEAQNAPQTTAGILCATIAADIPLNGPAVIRAAGGNPYAGNSTASLIEAEIAKGRSE